MKIISEHKKNLKFSKKNIILAVVFLVLAILYLRTDSFIKEISGGKDSLFKTILSFLPSKEDFFLRKRINVLVLGIRGEADPYGGLLSDSIMIASIDPEKNKLAIISIPRDLYVPIDDIDKMGKINSALFIIFGRGQPGVSTIVILVSFLFGMSFIIWGIIGEYLSRIYDEVKGRPNFIIRKKIGF